MNINQSVISVLSSNHLSGDELIYLYNEYFKCGWDFSISPGSILKLKKTGFLEESGKVSVIGESILLSLEQENPTSKVSTLNVDEQFEEFWKLFPKDDAFRHFPKTRDLRRNKIETLRQYKIVLNEYSHEQLIGALKNEIEDKKSSTIKNMFTFMKGSVNWLKDKAFLDYLNIVVPKEEKFHGKDISM